ncbi:NADH-quinone oxidoreductase subunit C, partial [Streptomyces purpurogeneiscleroticus]|uniref:NADH-quinone oxidoreductase subunit C n=1 Tax=Streptomyces purpurogeneiscleroticus TaxID=68259 RepID=UPI001CC0042E
MTAQPPEPGTPEEATPAPEATPAAPEGASAAPEGASAAASETAPEAAPEAEPAAPVGWLPEPAERIFGTGATAEEAYGLLTVDVPAAAWTDALTAARDVLGCTYFDWLSAVDEPGTGFRICAHVADVSRTGDIRRLLVRTTVPHEAAALPTAVGVYAGAGWHERETHEMFGVDFTGHPGLEPLLLPEGFEGHPLRKDFVLAARVAKAWPGAKEPGESEHGGPKRRQMLPPGVPDPNEWGPLKGQLPPVPARPARGAARGARRAG